MHRQWSRPSVLEQLLLRQPLQQGHAQALMGAWRWEELAPVQTGGVSGGPVAQGAPVSLGFALAPALQGGGVGYLRHRGGDSAGTFNTSTAVAVTAAACGVPVTKQATGAASDKGGSADVLGSLGGNLKASPAASLKALGTGMGLCFLFTPGWHPGLAELAPLRRSLGIRSVPCLTFWGHWSIPPSPADQVLGVRMPPC